jgi:hypothetical protein
MKTVTVYGLGFFEPKISPFLSFGWTEPPQLFTKYSVSLSTALSRVIITQPICWGHLKRDAQYMADHVRIPELSQYGNKLVATIKELFGLNC